MPPPVKPLWICPKCGAKLVTRNLWHSCGRFSLAALFARSDPGVLALFRKFAAVVRRCGPGTMIPQKSRVVFMARVRFAAAYPRKHHFIATFILGRRLRGARILRVEKFGPRLFGHHLKIAVPADLDAVLRDWLRESHRYYGRQERLRKL